MSDSDLSSDEEKVAEPQPDVPVNRKELPRHMRIRYWHSWEEMLLIELWRQHLEEVTCLDKNLPIFRTISAGMKNSGFHINGQEVRRKIKTLKNKYIAERRLLNENEDKNAKSEWRLYPLVHILMTQKVTDPHHEKKALKTILDDIEKDPLYHVLLSGMPVESTLERIEAGEAVQIPPPKQVEDSFPVENETVASSIAYSYKNKYKRSYTPRTLRPSEVAAAQAKMIAAEARAVSVSNETQAAILAHPTSTLPSCSRPSKNTINGNILKRRATPNAIKQLRTENVKLVEECVIAARRLKMEEQQFKAYEKIVQQIQAQYEILLQKLKVS